MTEEEKAAQKARPIATNPIPGTPWYVHYNTAQCIPPVHFKGIHLLHCFSSHHCMSVCIYFLLGVWYGRVMTVFFSTTQQRGCPCGTDLKSWLVELMLTNTSRSLHTREDWRMARRQVWMNTVLPVVSDYGIDKVLKFKLIHCCYFE